MELVNCQQSTLSHHMKLLVESGIVNARKEWKWTHYSINKEKIKEIKSLFNI
ncbi:MAG: ArsR family transcriptional regulator [Bacillales bacterium]|nr:ArsR family transcriptional regulator [Bacillales bacterium]